MDLREILVLSGGGGIAMACAASLLLAGRAQSDAIARLDQRVAAVAVRTPRPTPTTPIQLLGAAPPLFPVLSGPGAVPEVQVRLEGVARSPQRIAALVAIDGAPAAWLALGETREGVTLADVAATGVTLETARGPKTVRLGEGPAPPADAAPSPGRPEPASAPAAKP